MNTSKVTPKDFFLWTGAMIALYVSAVSLITLFFDYIDIAFPDALNSYQDPYSSGIRYSIASLVVLFPVFLLLMNLIRRDIKKDATKKDIWIRRWALFLTVFVAGATIVIDLITLINNYLNGDISTQFTLKVLIVFLVAGAGLLHFLADLWGYWVINPRYAQSVGIATGILIIATIASGFLIIGSPNQVRLYRFDDQKVQDLMNIQSQIVTYWQQKQSLPTGLSDLSDSINGFSVPVDSQTNAAYQYAIVGKTSFKLCAVFNADMQATSPYASPSNVGMSVPAAPVAIGVSGKEIDNTWLHTAGNTCFLRTIDPTRYPPFSKTVAQ